MRLPRATAAILTLCLAAVVQSDDSAQEGPFENHVVVRLEAPTARQMQALYAIGANPWSCRPSPASPEFLLTPEQRDLVDRLGARYHVLIPNVQQLVDEEQAAIDAVRQAQAQQGGEGGVAGDPGEWFAVYRTWPEVNAYIDELVALEPDIIEKFAVGTTHEDRTIYGMRITAPGDASERPIALFNGCQHAREWVAVMVPMFIADHLVRQYSEDEQIASLLEQIEFIIVPIVNPDGYEFSYADPDNRMWRKNRRFNGVFGHNNVEVYGVDLNRNWDVDWNGGESTSEMPWTQIYVGPSAFSEPESQAMRDLVLAEPRIAAHIDFHSYSQLVLHPLGYTVEPAPDFEATLDLAQQMSDAIFSVHGVEYAAGHGSELLYLASGIFPDWCYETLGIFGYTMEVRPQTNDPGFILPPDQIIPTCEENLAAALTMAKYVLDELSKGLPVCEADLTGDGLVGVGDLLALLGAWGECPEKSECLGDLTADGLVGVPDLLIMLEMWGECSR